MSDKNKVIEFPKFKRDHWIVDHPICLECPKNQVTCMTEDEVCLPLELFVIIATTPSKEDRDDMLNVVYTELLDQEIYKM